MVSTSKCRSFWGSLALSVNKNIKHHRHAYLANYKKISWAFNETKIIAFAFLASRSTFPPTNEPFGVPLIWIIEVGIKSPHIISSVYIILSFKDVYYVIILICIFLNFRSTTMCNHTFNSMNIGIGWYWWVWAWNDKFQFLSIFVHNRVSWIKNKIKLL